VSELHELTIAEAAELIQARRLSPVDLVRALLARLDRYDGLYRSHITVRADRALEEAAAAEKEIGRGASRGPLHGIPVSFKDNIWTSGVRTTAHSKTMRDFVPDVDATHVERLRAAGMILVGKTNTTEFATGDMLEFGDVPHPYDLAMFAGSSSGGSASAIAAGFAIATTGTDTAGSIRFPASCCGIVGVKPTYGRVSRYGVVPLSWTMDSVGPMTRTVRDAAMMLGPMSGHDPRDPHTAEVPVPDFTAALAERLDGVVLGMPEQHYYENLDPPIDSAIRIALADLEALGATLCPVSIPLVGKLAGIGSVIVECEAFALHADRLRRSGRDYGPKARRQLGSGAFYSGAEYLHALQVRELFNRELAASFAGIDALVMPTLPHTAYSREVQRSGPPDTSWGTRQFNLSGYPAMSIPCGFDPSGYPIGLQVAARPFEEATMFRVGHAYERATPWHKRRPPLEED
jgi:aspartyl-tRNA(Asn)/glutamyl-tRNA(Gln) amidotransferase subunit A